MDSLYNSTPFTTTATTTSGAEGLVAALLGVGVLFWMVCIVLVVITLIARWKVFKKANVDGWEALIPIHNDIVELQLGGVKTYVYFLNLIFICGIGPIIYSFWKNIALSKAFGKGTGFGILLVFFPYICYPVLAWGKAEFIGSSENNTPNNTPKTTTEGE